MVSGGEGECLSMSEWRGGGRRVCEYGLVEGRRSVLQGRGGEVCEYR